MSRIAGPSNRWASRLRREALQQALFRLTSSSEALTGSPRSHQFRTAGTDRTESLQVRKQPDHPPHRSRRLLLLLLLLQAVGPRLIRPFLSGRCRKRRGVGCRGRTRWRPPSKGCRRWRVRSLAWLAWIARAESYRTIVAISALSRMRSLRRRDEEKQRQAHFRRRLRGHQLERKAMRLYFASENKCPRNQNRNPPPAAAAQTSLRLGPFDRRVPFCPEGSLLVARDPLLNL